MEVLQFRNKDKDELYLMYGSFENDFEGKHTMEMGDTSLRTGLYTNGVFVCNFWLEGVWESFRGC